MLRIGFLALYPFKRRKLQQICAQFFEWPPEKADEYILPKIAERDLRRFANLHSTSSDLGVWLPLHEMPVKCPISGILKHRKVQGRECFEVSWEELDGLKSSIVPADLIESACPEKIVEFEEKKAQGRKQNHRKPRLKISENRASVAEIDLKLQDLLLDIELGSNSIHNASFSLRASVSDNITVVTEADLVDRDLLFNKESESDKDCYASTHCYPTGSYVAEKEVIDLLSPSPLIHTRNVSKCQQANAQHIDVIDLSESETDTSPEHERKARGLRLFLTSIRDDIS